MPKFRITIDYGNIPKGTIFVKSQIDVGYEDLTPYWAYTFKYRGKDNHWVFGEWTIRQVEGIPDYFEKIEE